LASPQSTTVCNDNPTRMPETINNGAVNLVIAGRRRQQAGHASPFRRLRSGPVLAPAGTILCAPAHKAGHNLGCAGLRPPSQTPRRGLSSATLRADSTSRLQQVRRTSEGARLPHLPENSRATVPRPARTGSCATCAPPAILFKQFSHRASRPALPTRRKRRVALV
jgi:hypothetical protein